MENALSMKSQPPEKELQERKLIRQTKNRSPLPQKLLENRHLALNTFTTRRDVNVQESATSTTPVCSTSTTPMCAILKFKPLMDMKRSSQTSMESDTGFSLADRKVDVTVATRSKLG